MAEYIERERIRKALVSACLMNQNCPMFIAAKIDQMIDCEPAADVAPVVHGRWVYNPNGMDWNLGAWQCSFCKCNNNNLPGNDKYNPYIFQGSNYCPNCGAKMDGEEHNNV